MTAIKSIKQGTLEITPKSGNVYRVRLKFCLLSQNDWEPRVKNI